MDSITAADLLRKAFPEAVQHSEEFRRETTVTVEPERIREILAFLKENERLRYDLLVDLAGVDFGDRRPRFQIVYLLHSTKFGNRLRIKTPVAEGASLDTVSDLWAAADWMEREVYDLFGIPFDRHPNLKRILLTDDFVGHPLRKDFPLQGTDFGRPPQISLEEER